MVGNLVINRKYVGVQAV